MKFIFNIGLFVLLLINTIKAAAVEQCCRKHKIPEKCAKTLCNPFSPPGDFDVYDIFERRHNCSKHLKTIAQCLADGRDHSHCCITESKDREESACFGLCQGEGLGTAPWTGYQTCIAINLPSMFSCFQKGYDNIPSPPQLLTATTESNKPVLLSWTAPLINPDLAHYYQVVCVENDSTTLPGSEVVKETRSMQLSLEDLQPSTKYYCYTVAFARDGKRKSLASDKVHFQTTGIAPRMYAYRPTVAVPKNAPSAILACRFQISGIFHSKLHLEWLKKQGRSYNLLQGPRYNLTHYVSSFAKPREYVTTLEIKNISPEDYGMYRCFVTYEFGSAHAEVELTEPEQIKLDSRPPNTPYSCCQSKNVDSRCLTMCGVDQKTPHMNLNCSSEIGKVLACAMPGIDDSSCCLRSRVPKVCMYLCDSYVTPTNIMPASCNGHLEQIIQCRYSGALRRPSTPKDVKVISSSDSNAVVQWKEAERADIYHVYWRRNDSHWDKKSTTGTSKTIIGGFEEVVVVAANQYGLSQPVKINNN